MAQQGKGQQALMLCFFASVFGGLISSIITMFAMPYLARIGYYMHSVEMVVVMLFGLTLIAVIASQDTLKGLIAGFFGLMLGAMGADHIYAAPRGTFGFLELRSEEHTSELQSLMRISSAVFCLKKKKQQQKDTH